MTFEDALEAHEIALRQAGGRAGLQEDRVRACADRPYSGYFKRIDQKAAALVHAFGRGHSFTDGNKRTAFMLMNLFLVRSGEIRRWLKPRIVALIAG